MARKSLLDIVIVVMAFATGVAELRPVPRIMAKLAHRTAAPLAQLTRLGTPPSYRPVPVPAAQPSVELQNACDRRTALPTNLETLAPARIAPLTVRVVAPRVVVEPLADVLTPRLLVVPRADRIAQLQIVDALRLQAQLDPQLRRQMEAARAHIDALRANAAFARFARATARQHAPAVVAPPNVSF